MESFSTYLVWARQFVATHADDVALASAASSILLPSLLLLLVRHQRRRLTAVAKRLAKLEEALLGLQESRGRQILMDIRRPSMSPPPAEPSTV